MIFYLKAKPDITRGSMISSLVFHLGVGWGGGWEMINYLLFALGGRYPSWGAIVVSMEMINLGGKAGLES